MNEFNMEDFISKGVKPCEDNGRCHILSNVEAMCAPCQLRMCVHQQHLLLERIRPLVRVTRVIARLSYDSFIDPDDFLALKVAVDEMDGYFHEDYPE